MNFNKKDVRIKYLEDKFDNLMDVNGSNYGEPLKKELISKLNTTIDDFNEFFDVGFPDDDFDTVGGLVINAFGHLPNIGENTKISQFDFKVLNCDNRKITLLEVTKDPQT